MILTSLLLLAFHSECLSVVVDLILEIEYGKNSSSCHWSSSTVYMKLHVLLYGDYIHKNILSGLSSVLIVLGIDISEFTNCKQYVNDIVRNGGSYRYYGDADDKQKFIKSLKRVDASHMADFELDSSYGNHLASIVALAKAAAEAAAEAAAKASADAAVDAKAVIERNEKRLNQATHDVPTKFRKY